MYSKISSFVMPELMQKDKEVVEELVRKNKLTNVQGYEEVLSRY